MCKSDLNSSSRILTLEQECGELLTADFEDLDPCALVDFLADTAFPEQAERRVAPTLSEPTECNVTGDQAAVPSGSAAIGPSSLSRESSHSSSEGSSGDESQTTQNTTMSTYDSLPASQSAVSGTDGCSTNLSFLELCVNQGESTVGLGEIHLRQIQNDGALFKSIRRAYYQLRGFRRWFFLLKPADVEYIKVSRAVNSRFPRALLIMQSSVLKSATWWVFWTRPAGLRTKRSRKSCTATRNHACQRRYFCII